MSDESIFRDILRDLMRNLDIPDSFLFYESL